MLTRPPIAAVDPLGLSIRFEPVAGAGADQDQLGLGDLPQ
jgi:hypothetical protein